VIWVFFFFEIFYFCGQLLKGQKQEERQHQKDSEHDRKRESGKEIDRNIEKGKRGREKKNERVIRWNFSSIFLNAAIQGGPASGDTRCVELRRYYIAARVPTCISPTFSLVNKPTI
jgi:hypothetical protein